MAIAEPPRSTRLEKQEATAPITWDEPLKEDLTWVTVTEAGGRRSLRSTIETLLSARVDSVWGWMPVAALVLFWTAVAIEPLPADPAPMTLQEEIIGWTFFLTIMAGYGGGAVAAFKGMRWGLFAALPASAVFAFSTLTCPASGHHAWGLWVSGTFACAGAALALNLGALLKTRGGSGA